ncbi:MAG: hypothetical protein U0232_24735 [Thermomicrobiales bacterium]
MPPHPALRRGNQQSKGGRDERGDAASRLHRGRRDGATDGAQPAARRFPLAFCTRRDAAAATLTGEGGTRLGDPVAVAAASDVLLTCLPADAEIEAVLLGAESALRRCAPVAR